MRTNQKTLVSVLTDLVTGPLVTSPKRRFPWKHLGNTRRKNAVLLLQRLLQHSGKCGVSLFTRCLPLPGNQSSKCLVLWIPRGYRLLDTLIPTCYLLLPERLMLDCRVQGEMCHPCGHRWRCPSSRQPRPDCFRGCVAVERCGRMRLASFGCSRWRDSNTPRRQPPAWQKKTRRSGRVGLVVGSVASVFCYGFVWLQNARFCNPVQQVLMVAFPYQAVGCRTHDAVIPNAI